MILRVTWKTYNLGNNQTRIETVQLTLSFYPLLELNLIANALEEALTV